MLTLSQLQSICATAKGRKAVEQYIDPLNEHLSSYGISTPERVAAFLAQIAHESQDFTRTTENLYYSDPARIALLFRTGFDLNNNRIVDPEEVEFAKGYAKNPQRLANRAYANRMGNGSEESGDGWRYRGRGLKQLTGKNNYRACGDDIGLDLVLEPELLELPDYAVESACWFWKVNGLNRLADAGDFAAITRRINGALTGLSERRAYLVRATEALAVTV